MQVHIRILLLVSLLVVFVCIGFLSSAQQLPTAKVSSPTTDDLPLFLNNEPIGSVANTQPLEGRFGSLQSKLDSNANSADGGLPNVGRIVFVPDDRLAMNHFGELWGKIDDFFDYPVYTRMALWGGQPCADTLIGPTGARGTTFVLSNSRFSTGELEKVRTNENCWLQTEVITTKPQSAYYVRLLKSYRTAVSSIEITDKGAYLLNQQVQDPKLRASPVANLDNPSFRRKVDAAQIKQRPIHPSSLEKEVDAWVKLRVAEGPIGFLPEEDRSVELPIIVAGQASYSTLAPILKLLGNRSVKLTMIVNGLPARSSAKPD